MTDRIFVDANVLVYSRDSSEPRKQKPAMDWMAYLWTERAGCLSFQVLQEFYVTVTRKLDSGLDPESARSDVRALLAWRPVPIDAPVLEGAWMLQDRHRLSWWDALVVSAAQASGCRFLLTEDLQEGQNFGTLHVIHPFRTRPGSEA
jgi:predicted nucleic acid-binding protein